LRVARGLSPDAIFYCVQSSSPAGRPSSRVGLAMVWHWVGRRHEDAGHPYRRAALYQPSWPGLSRPSTSWEAEKAAKGVQTACHRV